jgi:copper chaperone CopZ
MDDKCHVTRANKEVIVDETEHTKVTTLYVTGMGCVNCANRVHNSLIDHPGVIKAEVSHVTAQADVTYIPAKVDVSRLLHLVEAAGDNRHSYWAVAF